MTEKTTLTVATLEGKEISDPKPPLGPGYKAQIEKKRFAQLSSRAQGMWSTATIWTIESSSENHRQAGGTLGVSSLEGSCCLLVWASVHPRIERLQAEHTI